MKRRLSVTSLKARALVCPDFQQKPIILDELSRMLYSQTEFIQVKYFTSFASIEYACVKPFSVIFTLQDV